MRRAMGGEGTSHMPDWSWMEGETFTFSAEADWAQAESPTEPDVKNKKEDTPPPPSPKRQPKKMPRPKVRPLASALRLEKAATLCKEPTFFQLWRRILAEFPHPTRPLTNEALLGLHGQRAQYIKLSLARALRS